MTAKCSECFKEVTNPVLMDAVGGCLFCSKQCSYKFSKILFESFINNGSVLVNLQCGCFSIVHDIQGGGTSYVWGLCEKTQTGNDIEHRAFVHNNAVNAVRQRN